MTTHGTARCSLRGSLVALPTPFRGGAVDIPSFRNLIREHARSGTQGIVVNGTTGESCTLTDQERRMLVLAAVEFAAGELAVVAGVGTNDTRTSIDNARFAEQAGVDALLVVTPYYNRPGERGLLHHFGAVAEVTELPVMLYNVPTRTAVDLLPAWARELGRRHANIVAIKEASNSKERAREVCRESGLAVFCGEDSLIPEYTRCGAVGAVSVVGNLLPGAVAEWLRCLRPDGDPARADELARVVLPLVKALSVATNPVPVKAALAFLGKCSEDVRSPLLTLEQSERASLEARCREACVPV